MPKHIHISINGPVGEFEDEWGYSCYGFMAAYIDWMVGYNYEDGSIGYSDLEHVTFHINSDGGSVTEGFEILSKMEMLKEKGVKVEVINDSRAYSIASLLLQGASKGMRKSRSYALFMAHKPWSSNVAGNADELRKYADYLDKYEKPMVNVYVATSGKTEEQVQSLLREERFMTAEEAKAEGFIDEVLPVAGSEVKTEQIEKKAVAFYKPQSNQVQSNKMAITKEEKGSLLAEFAAMFGLKPKAQEKQAPAAANKPKPKPKAQEPTEPVAASTETADGAEIHYSGELEQGTEVFADAEMTEALEDGLYDLADGREIEVVEGAVANITEAEEEEEEEEPAAAATTNKPTPKAKADKGGNPLEAEVKALKAQVAKLSKQVPGSGNAGQKGAQNFNEGEQPKASSPFSVAASNAKRNR